MLDIVKPAGRLAVMDGGCGEVAALRPVISAVFFNPYAADGRRQPWLRVPQDTDDATVERFTGGYVWTAAGTRRSTP